jgi:hypothetical protein
MKIAGIRGIIIGKDPKNRKIRPIKPFVLRLIRDLREELPHFTGNRAINEERTRELRNQTNKLKKILTRLPEPLSAALFAPEMFFRLAMLQGTMLGINPQTRNYLSQTPTRLALLLEQLDWLRAQCDQIIRIKLGTHKGLDHRKLHAAIASRDLLEFVAAYTGKEPSLTVSLTSDYCKVASLFFEAVTGRSVRDFRQACETVAPLPLRTKG